MASDWSKAFRTDGYEFQPEVDTLALAQAASALGRELPSDLVALYSEANGVFDETGQWWVIWPLDRLTTENLNRWADGGLPSRFIAFGDDGTGDPFCLEGDAPDVLCWHPVSGESVHFAPSLSAFWHGWTTGDLTT